jgi:thiol-disulfide isomerase/thioredoxin
MLVFALSGCAPGADGTANEAGMPRAGDAAVAAVTPEIVPASAGELIETVEASGANAVMVNVWATWCAPCREEFPDLLRLRETYRERGLELILVSGDFDDQLGAAHEFLASHGVDFRTYIKTGRDMEFIDTLNPEWSGALPATFIYDGAGRRQVFWEGKATYDEMEQRLLSVLEARSTSNP